MMNNFADAVHHFLDIEAQVNNKVEDDEDDGSGLGELTLVFSMSAC